ncbi:MAG: alpha/beta hydrolase [Pseudomonadales bacterium]|nr:alpha/beta hydrolase [Pseudomonadales bacterium]
MPLDPTVEGMLKQMAEAGGTPLNEMEPPAAREMYRAMNGAFSKAEMFDVTDTDAAGVGVRIYKPVDADVLPCLVYYHGGGWVIGDLETHDNVCRNLARDTGAMVIATDYRLAPEHPFPAPLDDCYTVLCWVHDNAARLGVDRARIAVGGDSAGGNLSACVSLKARLHGGPSIAHQLLVYPVTDSALDTESYRVNAEGYMLTRTGMEWFFGHYIGDADRFDPMISPLRAENLEGQPPATVITAEFDPLRDEGEAYAEKLKAAGVDVTVKRFSGMIHGFFGMTDLLEGARDANALAVARLREAFA